VLKKENPQDDCYDVAKAVL